MARKRYYIACIPEEPVFNRVLSEQQYLHTTYGLKAMFNSPPHITLYRPFEWEEDKEEQLLEALQAFRLYSSIPLNLNGFDGFPKRVLYIRVSPSKRLDETYFGLRSHLRITLGLLNEFSNSYGFNPHITLAFRDLKPRQYDTIIAEYASKIFTGHFNLQHLTLLKHDQIWHPVFTFGHSNQIYPNAKN